MKEYLGSMALLSPSLLRRCTLVGRIMPPVEFLLAAPCETWDNNEDVFADTDADVLEEIVAPNIFKLNRRSRELLERRLEKSKCTYSLYKRNKEFILAARRVDVLPFFSFSFVLAAVVDGFGGDRASNCRSRTPIDDDDDDDDDDNDDCRRSKRSLMRFVVASCCSACCCAIGSIITIERPEMESME